MDLQLLLPFKLIEKINTFLPRTQSRKQLKNMYIMSYEWRKLQIYRHFPPNFLNAPITVQQHSNSFRELIYSQVHFYLGQLLHLRRPKPDPCKFTQFRFLLSRDIVEMIIINILDITLEKKILFSELIFIVKWTQVGFFSFWGDNIVGPDDRISVKNTHWKLIFTEGLFKTVSLFTYLTKCFLRINNLKCNYMYKF